MSTTAPAPLTRLRAWRKSQQITMRQAADLCGYSDSQMSLIETGRRVPSPAAKLRIARGLGVPIATLFDPPARDRRNGGRRG
jgi:transcriptional regulator with XRE-family HTH domain